MKYLNLHSWQIFAPLSHFCLIFDSNSSSGNILNLVLLFFFFIADRHFAERINVVLDLVEKSLK